MTGLTINIYAIVKSTTSNIAAPFYGQTFEMKDITPIYIIMNINGQESTLSHRDALIIDIENVYQQVVEEKEALDAFMGGRKIKASKEYQDKQTLINNLVLCLKDYIRINQIKINL